MDWYQQRCFQYERAVHLEGPTKRDTSTGFVAPTTVQSSPFCKVYTE